MLFMAFRDVLKGAYQHLDEHAEEGAGEAGDKYRMANRDFFDAIFGTGRSDSDVTRCFRDWSSKKRIEEFLREGAAAPAAMRLEGGLRADD